MNLCFYMAANCVIISLLVLIWFETILSNWVSSRNSGHARPGGHPFASRCVPPHCCRAHDGAAGSRRFQPPSASPPPKMSPAIIRRARIGVGRHVASHVEPDWAVGARASLRRQTMQHPWLPSYLAFPRHPASVSARRPPPAKINLGALAAIGSLLASPL